MTTTRPVLQDRRTDSPALRLTLVGLLAFIGLGGIFGGIQMLADPYQAMGMTTHMLRRTPFDSFVIPGVLLLGLVGVAALALAAAFLGHSHPHPGWGVAFGVGLMAWIATQWAVFDAQLWLQPAILVIALAITVVAAVLWRRENHYRGRGTTP